MGFILYIIAWVLQLPLTVWNYFLVENKKGYFRQSGLNLDIYSNYEHKAFWNKYLITPDALHRFGTLRNGEKIESISEVLGYAIIEEERQLWLYGEIYIPQLTEKGERLAKKLTYTHCVNATIHH